MLTVRIFKKYLEVYTEYQKHLWTRHPEQTIQEL